MTLALGAVRGRMLRGIALALLNIRLSCFCFAARFTLETSALLMELFDAVFVGVATVIEVGGWHSLNVGSSF